MTVIWCREQTNCGRYEVPILVADHYLYQSIIELRHYAEDGSKSTSYCVLDLNETESLAKALMDWCEETKRLKRHGERGDD